MTALEQALIGMAILGKVTIELNEGAVKVFRNGKQVYDGCQFSIEEGIISSYPYVIRDSFFQELQEKIKVA